MQVEARDGKLYVDGKLLKGDEAEYFVRQLKVHNRRKGQRGVQGYLYAKAFLEDLAKGYIDVRDGIIYRIVDLKEQSSA